MSLSVNDFQSVTNNKQESFKIIFNQKEDKSDLITEIGRFFEGNIGIYLRWKWWCNVTPQSPNNNRGLSRTFLCELSSTSYPLLTKGLSRGYHKHILDTCFIFHICVSLCLRVCAYAWLYLCVFVCLRVLFLAVKGKSWS